MAPASWAFLDLVREEAGSPVHEGDSSRDRRAVRQRRARIGRRWSRGVGGVLRLNERSRNAGRARRRPEFCGADRERPRDCRGGFDAQQRRSRIENPRHGGLRVRTRPGHVPGIDVGRRARGRRHVVPELAHLRVEDRALVDVGVVHEFGAGCVDERLEAEAVRELVEHDGDQVHVVAVVVVEPVVPMGARQAAGHSELRVELRPDVVTVRVGASREEVAPGAPVRERRRIPRRGELGVGEVFDELNRRRRSERAGVRGAVECDEARLDTDLDVAHEEGAPEVRGVLEGDQALRADGRARVAADRRRRSRVVEAGVRRVGVDDRERRPREDRRQEQRREREGRWTRLHLSAVPGGRQRAESEPSAFRFATTRNSKAPLRSTLRIPSG